MNKSLVVAAAGADGPRPTGMAVVTRAEMVRLEKFLTSHLIEKGDVIFSKCSLRTAEGRQHANDPVSADKGELAGLLSPDAYRSHTGEESAAAGD